MNILFVSNTKKPQDPLSDASTRYRCWYRIEDIRRLGHSAYMTTLDSVKAKWLKDFDFVVFHRPQAGAALNACLKTLNKLSIPSACDFDDFIFDPENWQESPAYICGRTSRNSVIKAHKSYLEALLRFDRVFVSTQPLAIEVQRCHPKAETVIVRNGLGLSWFDQIVINSAENSLPSIAYFSGNYSHDHDFKRIEVVLSDFLERNKSVTLHVYGHLNFNHDLYAPSQLLLHSYSHYSKLPELMMRHSVVLSPLVQNRFNSCKSAVKFIESASVGVPCVSSPIEDLDRFQCPGLIVDRSESWAKSLKAALKVGRDLDKRAELMGYARENVCSMPESTIILNIATELVPKNAVVNTKTQGLRSKRYGWAIENRSSPLSNTYEIPMLTGVRLAQRRLRKLLRDPEAFMKDSRFRVLNYMARYFRGGQ